MTDLELLFLVLGVIYLWECVIWAPRGSVQFRTWWGRRWRVAWPFTWLGNQNGAIVVANPLPPLGMLLSSNPWPLSVSPEAVLGYVPPSVQPARRRSQTGVFSTFEAAKSIEARGSKLLVNGEVLLKAASPSLASRLAEVLRDLHRLKINERGPALENLLQTSFDSKAVTELWGRFRKAAGWLTVFCNLLFIYLFAVAPAIIGWFGFSRTWPWLLVGALTCTLVIAILYRRAHRSLYPSREEERFTHVIVVLLSPASAVRAHDLLARPLLEWFHPLAVASVFCERGEFLGLAQEYLRELVYPALPLCPRSESGPQNTERSARELGLRSLEGFLQRNKVDLKTLLPPPLQADSNSRSFCPRCLSQFTAASGHCADCGGLALVPIPSK